MIYFYGAALAGVYPTFARSRVLFVKLLFALSCVFSAASLSSAEAPSSVLKFNSSRLSADEITLEWSGFGSLQSAESLDGPWSTVPDSQSPFTVFRARAFQYYRLVERGATLAIGSIIAVDERTVRITFDRSMGESALEPSNYAVLSEDGQPLEVRGAKFNTLSVVDLETSPQSSANYQLTINNVQDSAGQPVYFDGRNFAGNPKGAVVSAIATSSGRVVVAFNEPMADNAIAPQHYVIKDPAGKTLALTDADFDGPLTMVVVLKTAPQASVLYTVTVNNVTDLRGDDLAPTTKTAVFQGIAGAALVRAVSTDSAHVILTFSAPVGDSAIAPSTYLIEQLDAANNVAGTLDTTAAKFIGDQRTIVELSTRAQQNSSYRVTTTPSLADPEGAPLPQASVLFQGIPGARLLQAAAADAEHIILTFSAPVGDSAIAPSSYLVEQLGPGNTVVGKLNITSAQFVGGQRTIVELTTPSQQNSGYRISSTASLADAAGNPLPAASIPFQGIPGASLLGAVATDATHIVLTFSAAVGDSAIAPSSYLLEQLDSANNVVGELAVVSARFVGGQRTIVELTTPAQENSRYLLSATIFLSDAAGNPLPGASVAFDGMSGQPVISLAASTGPTSFVLTFSVPMSDEVLSPAAYRITQADDQTKILQVLRVAFVGSERRVVELTTEPQANVNYVIRELVASNTTGTPILIPATPGSNLFSGNAGSSGTPADPVAPRIVGAASLSNTQVIVAFSEPMAASAIQPEHYVIIQENVNAEAGYLRVHSAVFYNQNPSTILLTTSSQNELTYRVTAVNVTDLSGAALAPRLTSNGVLVDPTSALFPGTPPIGTIDSDGDGLSDSAEMRGWIVTILNVDGTFSTRGVTSDPSVADTDGDDLSDYQEANLRFDPRSIDTDDDQLNDYAEFNEIFSNGLAQDSDGDGLDDSVEFAFFRTSPLFEDTDGDQIDDGDEIIGNRNPLVSDLPRPEITIGAVNLKLNVKFTESNSQERRDLETREATSTLTSSTSSTFTRSDTVAVEAHMEAGYEPGDGGRGKGFINGGFSAGYTFQQSSESEIASERAFERSLSTDREVTKGFNVEREVEGAVMQVTVNLRNVSSLAYRVKNLQITAFIQDPQDQTRLTPVATLLPDSEPEEGFTLGPLTADRGPFIFSNTTIVPSLVESLMANASGLIFRISNYDIIDERGRNFAFSGQEIVERTARLVIDYGGASSLRAILSGEVFDEIQPGDETEIHRVATSSGRAIADTNSDGTVDRFPREIFDASGASLGLDFNGDGVINAADSAFEPDTIVVFDAVGKPVGIGLHQAMASLGLVRYDESVTPASVLTDDELLGSYSTVVVNGREKIFRIRAISNDFSNRKFWEILTPLGVDQVTDLNDLILKPNSPVSLNFVQDLDLDGLTADVEFFLRTSDSDLPVSSSDASPRGRDTDKDGLDDRFEALIGWTVTTPQRTYKAWSSPKRADSNFDGLADSFTAPAGWNDLNNNHLRDRFNEVFMIAGLPIDYVLDPIRRDTDGDGINDAEELSGFLIVPITGATPYTRMTNPLNPDTDGDTFLDGFERLVGLDPTDPDDIDTDGDGLPDPVENAGWNVTTVAVSTTGFQQGAATTNNRKSSNQSIDTDDDGLTDFEEFFLKTNPASADTDGDGIEDRLELLGFILPHNVDGEDLGILFTDILDADTDNDKRSDGAEAELVDTELDRWVVRVSEETPYRVYSHPMVADADFDSLVDGDEFSFDPLNPKRHTDPNKGNTDGDRRDDGVEFHGGTNPLAVDLRVTIIAQSVEISTPGQYNFILNVRPPDALGVAGLSPTPQRVFQSVSATDGQVGIVRVHNTGAYVARISYRWIDGNGVTHSTGEEGDLLAGQTVDYNPGAQGVPSGAKFYPHMRAVAGNSVANPSQLFTYSAGSEGAAKFTSGGTTLINTSFNYNGTEAPVDNPEDFPLADRSVSFGLAAGERFSIEGIVTGITTATTETVKLGGLEGAKAFQPTDDVTTTRIRPVLSLAEVQDKFLEEFYFEATVNGATVKIWFFYLIE